MVADGGSEMGPEPSNWELMRGITELKQALRDQTSTHVPTATYEINQKNIAEALAALTKALADERTERKLATTANASAIELLKKNIQDGKDVREKDRKQFWTSISIGGLLLVAGIFVTPIARAFGIGP